MCSNHPEDPFAARRYLGRIVSSAFSVKLRAARVYMAHPIRLYKDSPEVQLHPSPQYSRD